VETKLITVLHCNSLPEAYLAKQALELEGIGCLILNEHLTGPAQASQSIELQVSPADAERAKNILKMLNAGAKESRDKDEAISCPECGSNSILPVWKPPSTFLGRISGLFKHDITHATFKCSNCGNEFDVKW